MKKAQIMGQPLIYIFFAIVAALILYFGIQVIVGTKDTAERVEFETFANELEGKVSTAYQDASGSVVPLTKLSVPKHITEVCFVGSKELSKVDDKKLRDLIAIDNTHNVFFGGVDISDSPYRTINNLEIEGTICDDTTDRQLDLLLENVGRLVKVSPA